MPLSTEDSSPVWKGVIYSNSAIYLLETITDNLWQAKQVKERLSMFNKNYNDILCCMLSCSCSYVALHFHDCI